MLKARQMPQQNFVSSESVMERLQQDIRGFRVIAEILKERTEIIWKKTKKIYF